jgi:hypothetical protein
MTERTPLEQTEHERALHANVLATTLLQLDVALPPDARTILDRWVSASAQRAAILLAERWERERTKGDRP